MKLLLVAGLSALWISGCSSSSTSNTSAAAGETSAAAGETSAAAQADGAYQYVSADDAVKAAAGTDVHVLDVR